MAICGDVLHSRVARSNILALGTLGADVRVVGPPTLLPAAIERMGVTAFTDFDAGLEGADVVMMLRLQRERMSGGFVPSPREYHALYGLTPERLARAAPDALVMHPGPMNRGVEISSSVADDLTRSAIPEQVEMGVAIRMACLDVLTRARRGGIGLVSDLAILDGRFADGARGGVLVRGGRIAAVGDFAVPDGADRIDAAGALIAPGIVDVGVFAIDPPAFRAGGITRAVLMPDQGQPIDSVALVERMTAAGKPGVWIHPLAAATQGLRGGELAEIGLMARAGACGVATGRGWIGDSGMMHRLLSYAGALGLVVVTHAEDGGLAGDAVATEGEGATRMGLAAAPAEAEALAVARDLLLVEATGAPLHFRQLTTARALDLVRDAKRRGLPVTCGITPAHLLLSDVAMGGFRTFARLSPPLRGEADRQACLRALGDGTIDILCSGHDPRGPEAKRLPFADAEPGMAGAESLLALGLGLVREGTIDLPRLVDLLSGAPARRFGLAGGVIAAGGEADLIVIDTEAPWRIESDRMAASAGNTPFDGLPVQGRLRRMIKGGVVS